MSILDNLKAQTKTIVTNAVSDAKEATKSAMENAAEERRKNKEAAEAAKAAELARKQTYKKFKPRQKFDSYIAFDDQIEAFVIGKELFYYSELIGFDCFEDGSSVTQGGLGGSIIGAAVTGNIFGAMLGGSVSKKKTKSVCESMSVVLRLQHPEKSSITITFISSSTKRDSMFYKQTVKTARECTAKLQNIVEANQTAQQTSSTQNFSNQQSISAADEIMKFKELCEQGIISKEEFEAKRKQLLNL